VELAAYDWLRGIAQGASRDARGQITGSVAESVRIGIAFKKPASRSDGPNAETSSRVSDV